MGSVLMSETRFCAVIFDFGGVLTTSVWESFATYLRSEGLQPDTIKNLFRRDPEALADIRGLETGALTEGEFETKFGRRLGLRDPEGLIDSMFAGMKPDEPMVAVVKEIRGAGLHTGLISNSWSTAHYDRKLLAELFDTTLISAEVGLHKPQPEIYRLAADRLNVEPEECLFVDDLRENCEGAEAVGMTAMRHHNATETTAKLAELTGIALAMSA
jgi:epoxide hydrolase-like predicted phosphatase